MYFFRKASSVPSSPSPTNASGGSNGSSADKRGPSRRRERRRKPWHLSAYELGLQFTNKARIQSPPDSPYFSRKSQSPSPAPAQLDHLRWTSTAVPQPLPLPDTSLTRKPESSGLTLAQRVGSLEDDASSASKTGGAESTNSSSNFRKRFSKYANIESGDDFRLSIPARSAPASAFSSPNVSPPRSNGEADYFPFSTASNVPNSSSDFIQTRLSHDSSVENGYDSSRWVMASARSAPTSGFSSPIVSPQRSNDRDFLPSSLPPRESPLRDVPDLGRFAVGHASPMSPVKTMQSPDRSLRNSPMLQSPELNPHGPNKFSFPLHHKFVQGRSKEWPESSRVSAQNSRLVTTSPRSAPTSGFSSPVVSPQRSKTPDFLPSSLPPRESQVQDVLDLGRLAAGQASQMLPLKTMQSLDRYPRSRPTLQSPRLSAPAPNKFSFPLHRKLVQGSSKEWPESSRVSAHPLPLPPGASPSQSFVLSATPAVHNATEIPNASQKKATEWVKGKLLGCGTYGRVYVGTHRETGAYCAMKEVDIVPDDQKSAECVKQLQQEIRFLEHLKHPNIVQYYGSEVVDDQFYIYLEYVHPGSINKYIQEHYGHVTESIVRNFTRHILSGLAYLHSTKTIHRDIKGANLLVDASGTVKVADFGMAKHLTGRAYELSLKGSPHWMAPEVLKAVMRNDANPELALAVDIWSLGCTVIEMFTGKPPWGEFLGVQAMFNILNKAPPIPETLSAEGKDFLCCCLRRNPADRPSAVMLLDHPFLRDAKPQGSNP